ncbi:MAG: prolipoprotein diacylglyceryl transferase [Bacillus sp. (in: firmicutes)]
MENIQPLNRVAVELGPFTVYWYGIIIGIGILMGWLILRRESKKLGISQEIFADLLILAIPISIISARIYYVLFEWDYYSENPGDIIAIWNGGIAIHGAIIGGVITTIFFTRKRGVSFWKLTDILAPSIILGQAIGRWGNFFNQEAYGTEVTRLFLENFYLPDFIINQMYINGSYYHPTFLYESLWDIVGFVLLVVLRKYPLNRGEIFLSYLVWYSIGRFFVEGLRTDSLMLTNSLRVAQVISLVLIGTAILLILFRRRKGTLKYRDEETSN